jgi:hypothetical protein
VRFDDICLLWDVSAGKQCRLAFLEMVPEELVLVTIGLAIRSVWRCLRQGQTLTDAMSYGLFARPVLLPVWPFGVWTLSRRRYPFLSSISFAAGIVWLFLPVHWTATINHFVFWTCLRALDFLLYPPLVLRREGYAVIKGIRRRARRIWRSFVMQPSVPGHSMLYEYQALNEDGEFRLLN